MSIIKSIKSEIENFTGIKPALIEQDINSTIYVSNLAEDIICDIEEEDKEHLKNDYKHTMQINRSLSIGLLKSDSIYILIETDENRKSELLQALHHREQFAPKYRQSSYLSNGLHHFIFPYSVLVLTSPSRN